MGIQINGNTDTISAVGGGLAIQGASGDITGNVTGNVNSTGVSTFTNGPVLIGSGTSTGTASQRLQVTGGAYVSSNLGIGTNNPSDILHLQGIFRIDRQLAAQDQTYIRYFRQGTAKARFGLLADDSSIFFNATNSDTANHLVINSSGNIGIGSASPFAKLDIVGGGTAQLQVTGTEADVWLKSTGPGNTIWRILGSITNNTHRFRIYDQTNNAERFAIDSSGRVTIPNQPYARSSSSSLVSATNAIPLNDNNLNRGAITISGNRFTVPVSGAYVIGYHHLGNSGSGACQVEIRVNNNPIAGSRTQDTNSSNDSFGTQTIANLSANDYVEFWVVQGTIHNNSGYNHMWIWLIG